MKILKLPTPLCAFCCKCSHEVHCLIAGSNAFICSGCIAIAAEITLKEGSNEAVKELRDNLTQIINIDEE